MFIDRGVSLSGLNQHLIRALTVVDGIYRSRGDTLVLIATRWAKDSMRQAHEKGDAVDISRPACPEQLPAYKIKQALGINFTCVRVSNHYHLAFQSPSPILIKNQRTEASHEDHPDR